MITGLLQLGLRDSILIELNEQTGEISYDMASKKFSLQTYREGNGARSTHVQPIELDRQYIIQSGKSQFVFEINNN